MNFSAGGSARPLSHTPPGQAAAAAAARGPNDENRGAVTGATVPPARRGGGLGKGVSTVARGGLGRGGGTGRGSNVSTTGLGFAVFVEVWWDVHVGKVVCTVNVHVASWCRCLSEACSIFCEMRRGPNHSSSVLFFLYKPACPTPPTAVRYRRVQEEFTAGPEAAAAARLARRAAGEGILAGGGGSGDAHSDAHWSDYGTRESRHKENNADPSRWVGGGWGCTWDIRGEGLGSMCGSADDLRVCVSCA